MILEHLRLRRRVALVAAGVLDGRERDETLAHAARCGRCGAVLEEIRSLVGVLEADPVRDAEPTVPVAVLVARVERALQGRLPTPQRRQRWWLLALPAASAAVLAVAVLAPRVVERSRREPRVARATIPPSEATPLVAEDALRRIERNLAREHAARYLAEAGEVLVAVAATGPDCDRRDGRLDVGEAPERSRELLARRRLVGAPAGEPAGESVASARGVLDDVEMALRDVAALPSCVKRGDVDRLRQSVERRQLLMRIRLMTRELEG